MTSQHFDLPGYVNVDDKIVSSSNRSIAVIKQNAARQGGLEKYTERMVKALESRGCRVSLISCPLKSRMSFSKIAEFDRYCSQYLDTHPHDIIFGMDRTRKQTHIRAGNGVHAANLQIRRKVEGFFKGLSFTLNPLHRLLLNIEKESFEHPELKMVFANSHMVRNQILEFYKTDPQKIHVIHNGVEWEEMKTDFQNWPTVKNSNRYHFLFIGHNFLRKGLKKLLDALSQLSNRDFHLSVIGSDKNELWFKGYAEKLKLKDKVSFYGSLPSIRSFYQDADALVIPSLYDPFANVTVEALAMGLFVISSKMNGAHEILTPDSGMVFEHEDELVSALELAMKTPKNWETSHKIRNSVRHLDFSAQLAKLCNLCLS